ncbi:CRISPR-associated protein Cmr6 [Stigmatella aurantiaca]|uniref:CRISPR-associated protein Cmr6 n=1 Tax=Stigmatella aurantiaca TaxID=41 RepID=A0A1H7L907_STIAU|nr:type III-B CRISPR module RAMP protein Cmr6 [Stigmatella aurantiaca]SEK95533.1 CRISPR-associated protein Cmr6 [Stigmatella aurantiaca]
MWLSERHAHPAPTLSALSHAGLGYTRYAPLQAIIGEGDPASTAREHWLKGLEACREPVGYGHAYRRWWKSLQGPETLCFTVKALGRVLVGHGTSAATGVGLTLHHTWGVPVLPGSSLKGLTAHYVETVYGPAGLDDAPERAPFRGTTWEKGRATAAPGSVYRRLFGAPDVGPMQEGGSQGRVIFHDAWWASAGQGARLPLARDVLTVHQRGYYESEGGVWPGDFDDPNPVSFLTVAPGSQFLVALSLVPGKDEGRTLLERAARYLQQALGNWGVGGKTAAGYGRFLLEEPPAGGSMMVPGARVAKELETPTLKELKTWLEQQKGQEDTQRKRFQRLEQDWRERLLGLAGEERQAAAHLLKGAFNLKRGEEKPRMEALLAELGTAKP